MTNIYVGNISWSSSDDSLRGLFESYGSVESAKILTDRATGRSRGFGFVEMADDEEAKVAIQALDGKEFDGRPLKVNEAKPRDDRGQGSRQYNSRY